MVALRLRELDFRGLELELEPWAEVLLKLGELGFSGFGNKVNNHLPRCIARRTRSFLEEFGPRGWLGVSLGDLKIRRKVIED